VSGRPADQSAVALRGVRAADPDLAGRREVVVDRGRFADPIPAKAPGLTLPLEGHLLVPALVNAHDHLHLNAVPRPEGIGLHPNAYAWIEAFQPRFRDPAVVAACAVPEAVRAWHGGLKNLLSGALLVAHHDPWLPVFDEASFPVRVVRRMGWSHSLGLERQYGPSVAESYSKTPRDAPWIIHLAEGVDDVAGRELSLLEAAGALGANTVLVHGLGLGSRDVDRVLERRAAVVWCPSSNLFMFGRTLDPRPFASRGALALGTDSRFTGAFDLLTELRVASASGLSPRDLVPLITSSAARLLGDPDAGRIVARGPADFLLLRDPGGDAAEALVAASRADLRAVVRNGVPAVADPDLAPWFDAAGEEAVPVRLDGRPKLCAARFLGLREAAALEPGLELV